MATDKKAPTGGVKGEGPQRSADPNDRYLTEEQAAEINARGGETVDTSKTTAKEDLERLARYAPGFAPQLQPIIDKL